MDCEHAMMRAPRTKSEVGVLDPILDGPALAGLLLMRRPVLRIGVRIGKHNGDLCGIRRAFASLNGRNCSTQRVSS
jgi:hypothetical protein